MADTDSVAMPIGAVTQLTGISSHTLRKWESRYEAVVPARTESGRRLYTQDQVHRLVLLRDLIRRGHQISQLSDMTSAELVALAAEASASGPEAAVSGAVVVGLVLTAQLRAQNGSGNIVLVSEAGTDWLRAGLVEKQPPDQALVVELPTVSDTSVARLAALRREKFTRVVVVYGYATRKMLRRLLDAGMLCLKAPVSTADLLKNLQFSNDAHSVLQSLEAQAVPAHRFSTESIAKLAALSPKLQCECPNHIAQLLLDISAFEQYSMECEDTDSADRAVHARLRVIAANARALFEQAMAEVAASEGLELEEL